LRFKYSSFFVALSRVRHSKDLRFLYKEKTRYKALKYLQELKPEDESSVFYHAYVNNNGKWQPDIAAAEACRRGLHKKN
jgi:hypothetical protein